MLENEQPHRAVISPRKAIISLHIAVISPHIAVDSPRRAVVPPLERWFHPENEVKWGGGPMIPLPYLSIDSTYVRLFNYHSIWGDDRKQREVNNRSNRWQLGRLCRYWYSSLFTFVIWRESRSACSTRFRSACLQLGSSTLTTANTISKHDNFHRRWIDDSFTL